MSETERHNAAGAVSTPGSCGAAAVPRSSDLMRVIAELESRFPVLEWRVAGVPVWPLMRIRWFFREWERFYATRSEARSAPAVLKRAAELIAGPLRAALAARRPRSSVRPDGGGCDVLFHSDGVSFAKLGEHWVERFCDPLLEAVARRSLDGQLWVPSHVYRRSRATNVRFVQPQLDRANLWGAFRSRASAWSMQLPGHEAAVRWLADHGWESGALASQQVSLLGHRLRSVADMYRRSLKSLRPRLAFIVSYYSLEGMAFLLACRELGILSIDLQHGVQGELHPAYAAWPCPAGRSLALLPDRFWVWSSVEQEVISRWSDGTQHAAVIGGNPWSSIWNDGSHRWPGVDEAVARAELLHERADRPVVLVTLQYGLADAEQLLPVARLLSVAADRLVFWVRLHPFMLEQREKVRRLLAGTGRFELDEPTDIPLHALLPHVDVHLTHSSSTVIEAAQFGIKSVVTSRYGEELFAPLQAAGWAHTELGDASSVARELESKAANASAGAGEREQRLEPALERLLAEAEAEAGISGAA